MTYVYFLMSVYTCTDDDMCKIKWITSSTNNNIHINPCCTVSDQRYWPVLQAVVLPPRAGLPEEGFRGRVHTPHTLLPAPRAKYLLAVTGGLDGEDYGN